MQTLPAGGEESPQNKKITKLEILNDRESFIKRGTYRPIMQGRKARTKQLKKGFKSKKSDFLNVA